MKRNYKSAVLFLTFLIVGLSACKKDQEPSCDQVLFGIPNGNTGLDASICTPVCACKNFSSKTFSAADLAALRSWVLLDSVPEITVNPYLSEPNQNPACLCAVVVDNQANKEYHLENFNSEAEAEAVGAIPTHFDACGVCSSLSDFAVYAENIDIGADVRACAILNLANPIDSLIKCIEELGFSKPCAQIWAYNAKNTQAKCFDICIQDNIYNNPDGSLGACLDCDERLSGPVFKAVAGRTRRNTGIASSICRFCSEVQIVEHNYPL